MQKRLPSLILHLSFFISIFILGAFLRLEHLGRQSYWMDEGYTVNAVISGMQNGTKHFASVLDSGSTYACPMYCLPAEWVSGSGYWALGNPMIFRLPAALFGILFVMLSYWIANSFFKDKRVALITMFLTSFSYIQIAWSRQARWYTELEVFFWLALGCFYGFLKSHSPPAPLASERGVFLRKATSKLLSKLPSPLGEGLGERTVKGSVWKSVFWLVASLLFSVAAILTHPIAYALPLIMFVWFVIEKRPSIKHLLIATALMIGFVTFMEYGLGLHSLVGNLAKHFSLHQNLYYYASFYWRNYWILIIFSVIGFVLADKEQHKAISMLALPFFAYLIGLSFFTEAIEYRYMFHTTVALYVMGGFGMACAYDRTCVRMHVRSYARLILHLSLFISFFILFLTQHLILTPQPFYWLEADNPATVGIRDYYAYTPQPDWNQAYGAIKDQMKTGDIVISSHPHFNKIFLNQSGYWLAFDYLGRGTLIPKDQTHEYYVNASVIHDLDELKTVMADHHGFIVFDLQSTDRRISKETIDYIKTNLEIVFNYQTNNYSEIWVYRF